MKRGQAACPAGGRARLLQLDRVKAIAVAALLGHSCLLLIQLKQLGLSLATEPSVVLLLRASLALLARADAFGAVERRH